MKKLTGTTEQFAQLAEVLRAAFQGGLWSTDSEEKFTLLVELDDNSAIYESDESEQIGGKALCFSIAADLNETNS